MILCLLEVVVKGQVVLFPVGFSVGKLSALAGGSFLLFGNKTVSQTVKTKQQLKEIMYSVNLLSPGRCLSNFPQGPPQMETVWLAQQSAPATSLCMSGFDLVSWLALTNLTLSLYSRKLLLPSMVSSSYCLCHSWGCPKTKERWIGLGVNCSEQTVASKRAVMSDRGIFSSALQGRAAPSAAVSEVLF